MRFIRFVVLCSLLGWCIPGAAEQSPVRASIVSFGLWDAQNVFSLEATNAAAILARGFPAGTPVLVRANTPGHVRATATSLSAALTAAAGRLDRENDLLVLVVTSHGSPEGIAIRTGRRVQILAPGTLGKMLADTGVRHRLVIVSACFSGVFADALADADTLVLTAADATHPSFGCTATARWTWFGQALFSEALQRTRSLTQAFAMARQSIAVREQRENFEPSNPQIRGGEHVLPLLDALTK